MATLFLRRVGKVLVPFDDEGYPADMPGTWKEGDTLRCDVKKSRNISLHRKAFVLLKIVFDATNYPSMEALRNAMTVGSGYVDTVINPITGETCFTPKSWAFDKLDETEFRALYNAMIGVALVLVPESTREGWQTAVDEIARL